MTDTPPLAAAGRLDRPESTFAGLTAVQWTQIGTVAVLLGALFFINLWRLWLKTNPIGGEANWGHSFLVPLIGLYYLYLNREQLLRPTARALSSQEALLGLWAMAQVMLWGVLFFVWVLVPSVTVATQVGAGVAGAVTLGVALYLGAPVRGSAGAAGGRAAAARRMAELTASSSLWFGIFMMIWGILFFIWSIYPGQNDWCKDVSMSVTLFGVVLVLGGWGVMKTAWFPIFFLICAYPWPALFYSKVAMPLQNLAASAAVATLRLTGVAAFNEGTRIVIGLGKSQRILNVAEACAGLKSLMTFITVAAAMAFLSSRALWQRILMTLSAVPIAIFCNMMRVTGQGLLDTYVSQWISPEVGHQLSESFAHQFVGLIMLIPAFFLILLVGWILDRLFIEEVGERAAAAIKSQAGRAKDSPLVIEVKRPAAVAKPGAVSAAPVKPAAAPVKPAAASADLAAAARRLAAARGPQTPGAGGGARSVGPAAAQKPASGQKPAEGK